MGLGSSDRCWPRFVGLRAYRTEKGKFVEYGGCRLSELRGSCHATHLTIRKNPVSATSDWTYCQSRLGYSDSAMPISRSLVGSMSWLTTCLHRKISPVLSREAQQEIPSRSVGP